MIAVPAKYAAGNMRALAATHWPAKADAMVATVVAVRVEVRRSGQGRDRIRTEERAVAGS